MKQISILLLLLSVQTAKSQIFKRSMVEYNSIFADFFRDGSWASPLLPDSIKDGTYEFYDNQNKLGSKLVVRNHSLFKRSYFLNNRDTIVIYALLKAEHYHYDKEKLFSYSNFDSTSMHYRYSEDTRTWNSAPSIIGGTVYNVGEGYSESESDKIIEEGLSGNYIEHRSAWFHQNGIKYQEWLLISYIPCSGMIPDRVKIINGVQTPFEIETSYDDSTGKKTYLSYTDSTNNYITYFKYFETNHIKEYKRVHETKGKIRRFVIYSYLNHKLISKDIFYENDKFELGSKSPRYHKDY